VNRLCEEVTPPDRASDAAVPGRANGLVYIDCRSTGRPTVPQLFREFGRVLGGSHYDQLIWCWHDRSARPAENMELLLGKLRHGSYLLVLDNMEDMVEVDGTIADPRLRGFVHGSVGSARAPGSSYGLKILVTSRRDVVVEGDQRPLRYLSLPWGLPGAEAAALLRSQDPDGQLGLRDAPEAVIERVIQRCEGVPRAFELIAERLRRDSTLTLDRLLADDPLFTQRVVENLVQASHDQLLADERRVIEALSLFGKPVAPEGVQAVLKPFLPETAVEATLSSLVSRKLAIYTPTPSGAAYGLHPFEQEYAYARIPETGEEYSRKILHGLAADYCDLLRIRREASMRDYGRYQGWYRYEDDAWQEVIHDWLYHLGRTDEKTAARLALARKFMDAFWWWGSYIEFPFCRQLLDRWEQTALVPGQAAAEDREWVLWLRQFHDSYHREEWLPVIEALGHLRGLAGVRDEDPEPATDDQRQVRILTDAYLGDAYRFLEGDDRQRAEYWELSEAYYLMALDGFGAPHDKAWIHFYLADLFIDQGKADPGALDRAVRHCVAALDAFEEANTEDFDYELVASIHRVLGDFYYQRQQFEEAFQSYNRAAFCAYAFQGIPPPPDPYTGKFYRELLRTIRDRLRELPDRTLRRQQIEMLRDFWAAYWNIAPAAPAGLRPHPFPPAPELSDFGETDGAYVSRVRKFVDEKAGEIELITL
jgi:hypothetical protein